VASKDGQFLARSLVGGVFAGLSNVANPQSRQSQVNPFYPGSAQVSPPNVGDMFTAGMAGGASTAWIVSLSITSIELNNCSLLFKLQQVKWSTSSLRKEPLLAARPSKQKLKKPDPEINKQKLTLRQENKNYEIFAL
jgi:hypothetical protein